MSRVGLALWGFFCGCGGGCGLLRLCYLRARWSDRCSAGWLGGTVGIGCGYVWRGMAGDGGEVEGMVSSVFGHVGHRMGGVQGS